MRAEYTAETNKNKRFSWIECLAAMMLIYWCNIVFFIEGNSFAFKIVNFVSFGITAFVILFGIRRIKYFQINLILVSLGLCLYSLILPAGSRYLQDYLFPFLVAGIMGVLMVSIIQKPRYIIYCWMIYSVITSIQAVRLFTAPGGEAYYMPTANYLFNLFVILIIYAIKTQKWYYYIPVFICGFCIIFTGTRGIMIAMILSIFSALLLFNSTLDKKRKRKIIVMSALIVFLIYFILFTKVGNGIIENLSSLLNIQSRVLSLVSGERISSSSERTDIYTMVFKGATENPIFGYGFCGDMYVSDGNGAHNFVLEIFVDFGLIGIVALFLFFILAKKSLFQITDEDWKIVGLMFFCVAILPKFVSHSVMEPITLPTIAVLLKINGIIQNNRKAKKKKSVFN